MLTLKTTVTIFSLLIFSLTLNTLQAEKDEESSAILIGFIMQKMTHKEKLINKLDRVISIYLKNIETNKNYKINLINKNYGIKKVPAGVYCLSKIKPYKNITINYCKGATIKVNPGELKNAGYWIGGINYSNSRSNVKFKLFDAYRERLNLYENAAKYDANFMSKNFKAAEQNSLLGYWYTAQNSYQTYRFDEDGKFFYASQSYKETQLEYSGDWEIKDNLGTIKPENNHYTSQVALKNGSLYGITESTRGDGKRWLAHRNPIRDWSLKNVYSNPIVGYTRAELDKIVSTTNDSVFIKIQFSTYEPSWPISIGRRVFMSPNDQTVIDSNLSPEHQQLILRSFNSWNFTSITDKETITICMIKEEYPEPCIEPEGHFITFDYDKKFPIAGIGLLPN